MTRKSQKNNSTPVNEGNENLQPISKLKLTKEERKAARIERRNERAERWYQKQQSKQSPITIGAKVKIENTLDSDQPEKKSFFRRKSEKKPRERVNFKVALREFPVKMAKEISRIHWAKKGSLGRKFLITIAFIIVFAVFYFVLDLALSNLLEVARVVK